VSYLLKGKYLVMLARCFWTKNYVVLGHLCDSSTLIFIVVLYGNCL